MYYKQAFQVRKVNRIIQKYFKIDLKKNQQGCVYRESEMPQFQ